MKNLKPFYNQIIKFSFFFAIIIFLIPNIFVCHIYTAKAFNSDYNFTQDSQIFPKDPHHSNYSSGSCHSEKESLINQNEFQGFLTSNKIQNNQKLAFGFNFIISEELSNSTQQKDVFLISSENLDNSQTAQLLTIAKIE